MNKLNYFLTFISLMRTTFTVDRWPYLTLFYLWIKALNSQIYSV